MDRLKVFSASLGFMTDSYDQFCITHVLLILKYQYGITPSMSSAIASSALGASIVGMLVFGYVASGSAHKRLVAFLLSLSLVIVGALGSASLTWGDGLSITIVLSIFRSVMGVGIGGEYPLTSNVARDNGVHSSDSLVVFAFQGVGNLLAAASTLLFVTVLPLNLAFRFILGLGALLGLVALPLRYLVYRRQDAVPGQHVPIGLLVGHAKENWVSLLGCAGSWFLFDVSFYGNALFMDTILVSGTPITPARNVYDKALLATYICLGALPGYALALVTLKRVGLATLQLLGFTMLFFVFGVMSLVYPQLTSVPPAFVVLFGLTFLFSNWGPNSTTFVLPVSEDLFPEEFRTFAHGVSAAFGKLGALVGAISINAISTRYGVRYALCASAVAALAGGTLTFFCFLVSSKKRQEYIVLN